MLSAAALWTTLTLALSGCVVVQPGSIQASLADQSKPRASAHEPGGAPPRVDVPASPDAIAWPERWGTRAQRIKGVIEPVEGPLDRWVGVRLGERHQLRAAESERAALQRLAHGEPDVGLYRFRAEGPGSYVFVRSFQDPPPKLDPSDPDEPAELFRFISAQRAHEIDGVPHLEIERTWFALYDPSPTAEHRGVVVLLPGMFGTPQPVIHTTVRRLRAGGWSVLRMLSHPGRFTQRSTFKIDPGDIDSAGAAIARVFDDRAAEVAYSVEGAIEHVHTLRPALRDLRHVLLGMSGGAMALPAVHARTPDLYDAAVLIAGGSNFLRINMLSNYADWIDSVELDWESPPSQAQRERLLESYLERATLDAYNTAPLLRSKPVLVLHAARDKAVPAMTGEELWRRLGEPERWVFPVGHELIFAALPFQLDRLIGWLDHPPPRASEDPGS